MTAGEKKMFLVEYVNEIASMRYEKSKPMAGSEHVWSKINSV